MANDGPDLPRLIDCSREAELRGPIRLLDECFGDFALIEIEAWTLGEISSMRFKPYPRFRVRREERALACRLIRAGKYAFLERVC